MNVPALNHEKLVLWKSGGVSEGHGHLGTIVIDEEGRCSGTLSIPLSDNALWAHVYAFHQGESVTAKGTLHAGYYFNWDVQKRDSGEGHTSCEHFDAPGLVNKARDFALEYNPHIIVLHNHARFGNYPEYQQRPIPGDLLEEIADTFAECGVNVMVNKSEPVGKRR